MSDESRLIDIGATSLGADVFRQLVETGPDPMVVVDETGHIVLANNLTEQIFGYPRSQLLGRTVEMLVPARFTGSHVAQRAQYFASPRVRPMGTGRELHGRKADGTEFPIEISLSPLRIGEQTLVSASIRDISDRKRIEAVAKRTQEHLLSALESVQGGFAIFDRDDALVVCNSEYRSTLTHAFDGEANARPYAEVVDANLAAGTFDLEGATEDELRDKLMRYHESPQGALDLRTSEGRHLRVVERRTAEGGTVTTVWDVTSDVLREEELRRARAEAEAASSAKSEFLASMSHELRTPLNAILGFAQLLHRDKKMPLADRHRERVEHVLKGGEHLLHLIDDVLDLARVEAGAVTVSVEPVRLGAVLAELQATLSPLAARAGITLEVVPLDPDMPDVFADRTRLKQILMNFGSNTLKYGHHGGQTTFVASVAGSFVRIAVKDDGIGIPADKQDKIFQPFHRAGQEAGPIEGTGIGLAIVKRLAELMGGRVGFQSTQGVGSEFWIDLPIHTTVTPGVTPVIEHDTTGRLLQGEGARYLVVYIEDNPSNIAFMEDLLADFDRVELAVAPTAEIGLDIVRARRPHVVIMDINLPGMSGFEATRRLRSAPETSDIPIVALSAAAMKGDRSKVEEAGFYCYLTKPVKVDELTAVLEELLVPNGGAS